MLERRRRPSIPTGDARTRLVRQHGPAQRGAASSSRPRRRAVVGHVLERAYQPQSFCNGAGNCGTMSPISCGAYVCNGPGTRASRAATTTRTVTRSARAATTATAGRTGPASRRRGRLREHLLARPRVHQRVLRRRLLLQRLRVRHLPDVLLGLVRQRRQRIGRTERPLPREPALRQHGDLHRRRLHPGRGRHDLRRRLLPERDYLPARGEVQRGGELFVPATQNCSPNTAGAPAVAGPAAQTTANARAAPTATRARARRRMA